MAHGSSKAFRLGATRGSAELAPKPALGADSEHLFVLWGEPEGGRRLIIGELWRDAQGFAFGYGHEIDLATAAGFRLLPEFPVRRDLAAPYRSPYLFATFAQRIPSPRRPDFERILESWGVQVGDSQLAILARSGGVQMTDRIELAEYRAADDPLERPLVLRVAGMRHYPGGAWLKEESLVLLAREPQNLRDPFATAIFTEGGEQVGYVPRQYAKPVAKLIDAGVPLVGSALRPLTSPADGGRWLVQIMRQDLVGRG